MNVCPATREKTYFYKVICSAIVLAICAAVAIIFGYLAIKTHLQVEDMHSEAIGYDHLKNIGWTYLGLSMTCTFFSLVSLCGLFYFRGKQISAQEEQKKSHGPQDL